MMINSDTYLKIKTTLETSNNIHELRSALEYAAEQISELLSIHEEVGCAVVAQDRDGALKALSKFVEGNPAQLPDFIHVEQIHENQDGSVDYKVVMGEEVMHDFDTMAKEQSISREEVIANLISREISNTDNEQVDNPNS